MGIRRPHLPQGLHRGTGIPGGGARVVARRTAGGAVDLGVELCGIPLATPLVPAAGTLSKEVLGELRAIYGALLPKTITSGVRVGNRPPRLAEVSSGMVNTIGLQ